MPTTTMEIIRDISGVPTYGTPVSNSKSRGLLVTNTAATVTAPTQGTKQYLALFSFGANVWVSFDGNPATVPGVASETTDCELNPQARRVESGQSISLITSDTNGAEYGVVFYSLL